MGVETSHQHSVLIADEEPVYRAGLKAALPGYRTFEYGGENTSSTFPNVDLAIIGTLQRRFTAIGLITQLTDRYHMPVIAIIGAQNDVYLQALAKAGVTGFVARDDKLPIVSAAVESVIIRKPYISHQLFPRVILLISNPEQTSISNPEQTSIGLASKLTARQMEVWELLAHGLSNKEIARTIDFSESTVKNYVTIILDALEPQLGKLPRSRMGLSLLWNSMENAEEPKSTTSDK